MLARNRPDESDQADHAKSGDTARQPAAACIAKPRDRPHGAHGATATRLTTVRKDHAVTNRRTKPPRSIVAPLRRAFAYSTPVLDMTSVSAMSTNPVPHAGPPVM